MPLDIVHSACPHDCPSTCALDIERLSPTRIGKVRGSADNTYTAGVVCAKVARYAERQHHPDRLAYPLRRVGGKGEGIGAFQRITWKQALDETAEAFEKAVARHGRETVWPYFYAGTMGLVQRDGIERLRHALGYSRQLSTICVALSDAGWFAGAGVRHGADSREIADSDLVVVWGGNPVHTQVNLMTHISRARKNRGAKLVVIDPYRTGTAEVADMHIMPRPGTDAALACAVMHVLFKEGFADREYMQRYTDAPDELEAHLQSRDPAWAERLSGVPAATIVEFARMYGRTPRSFIRIGYGFTRSRNGSAQMHAVSCLPAVTGAWKHRGGGALYANGALYKLDRSLIEGHDLRDSSIRLLDQSRIGPVLTGDKRDLGDGPPITAMLIQNTNPMVVAPETNKVRTGFMRDDLFTCVHEQFMTDTAKMADIVLPATTFLEHDDIYTSSGHTHLHLTRKVVEPLGEARPNHFVICELAHRLGGKHRGFEMTEWEIIEETLRLSKLPPPSDFHQGRWLDCALPFEEAHFLKGFGFPDGKFRFKPDWKSQGVDHAGMPVLPDQAALIDDATSEHPFRLVAAPARQFLNSTFTETPGSLAREGRPTVLIHPQDCGRLGIVEGSRVRLGNTRGSIVVHARPFDGLQPGVVVVESVWPNAAFEEGSGVNTLTSADAGPPKGGAVFHDTAIWIRAA
ncbi:MAG TPA: molybdopterin oxidoreductase family protein [Dongiaceae bacterium]|jgi:anaerobic selenocysteine-containing dehydrogenase|nr:molybdopterin oxidoreductase family protein [Dongiaceae bacterium]